MGNIAEEFKVSIIADASDIDTKISESGQKLKIFQVKANQDAQIKLKLNIAELESSIAEARKRLTTFKSEGDKAGEIVTRLEISDLQSNKNAASKALKGLQTDAQDTGSFFDNLGQKINNALAAFLGIQLAIKAFTFLKDQLNDAFNASVKFESAFAGIKKTVNASEEEFQKLSDAIIETSKTIPVAADQLANIGQTAGQLGVKKGDILEFTKTIAAISVSTNLTAEAAATDFARISNIFQEPVAKVSNLASSVVALGNNFATTETEIVNFTTRIAGAGKIAGLSTADLAGISAAFTSVGVDAEAGGTAVSKTLQSITDAVNKGGTDLNNFASVSGVSAKKFTELWKSDPVQAFNLFIEGLGKSGQKGSAILEDLVGGDQRLKRAFLGVAGAGDLLSRAITTSNSAFDKNTALTDEANKRYATTESKLTELDNRFTAIKITVGNFLKEAAVPVLDFFVTLAEALAGQKNGLTDVAEGIKAILSPAILLFKAIGFLIEVLGKGFSAIQDFQKSLDDGSTSSKVFKVALGVLGDTLLFLLNPLLGVSNLLLQIIDSSTALDTATKNLKKTMTENFKVPSLDTINKQFTDLTSKAHSSSDILKQLTALQAGGSGNTTASSQLNSGAGAGATVSQALDVAATNSAVNVGKLEGETKRLLGTLGLTKDEIAAVTSNLTLFNGGTELSVEDQQLLNQKIVEQSPIMDKLASDFGTTAEAAVASGKTWTEGIKVAVDKNQSQFEKNGQNAGEMIKTIEEKFVANVAKSGDLGKAAGVAYGTSLSAQEVRDAIDSSGVKITDQQLLVELKAAEASGDKGKAAGLLYALGLGNKTNIDETIKSSKNLHSAIQNTFNAARSSIAATGQSSGATLIAGIINGINAQVPTLGSLLSKIVKAIGGLSSLGGAFTGIAASVIGEKNVAAVQSFASQIGNKAAELQQKFNTLTEAGKDVGKTPPFSGGGGGGGGKGLDEAKKKAEEAKKAVDDFTKSVEDNNKAAEKLRNDTVSFYKDIVDSIDKAREKQADLTGELSKFNSEQDKGLSQDAAKRDATLAENEIKAQKDLAKAKADVAAIDPNSNVDANATANQNALAAQTIAQEKYNVALQKGTLIEQQSAKLALDKANQAVTALQSKQDANTTDDQKKLADAQDALLQAQQKLNDITKERSQIADFQTSLIKAQADAQAKYYAAVQSGNKAQITSSKAILDAAKSNEDAFNQSAIAQTLTQFQQTKLEADNKKAAKAQEIADEEAKQQQIIDIQQRFLDLQNAKTVDDKKKKQQLSDLANSQDILTQQQKQDQLTALGFSGNLTVDQTDTLLKQAKKASDLAIEAKQIEDQQATILATKQKYQDLAQKYHSDSVDAMKTKEQELIDLIKTAQAEQIKLNSLAGITGQAAGGNSNTTNVNVVNNNASNVDANAATNNLIRKVK